MPIPPASWTLCYTRHSGTVNIQSPVQNLGGQLTPLPSNSPARPPCSLPAGAQRTHRSVQQLYPNRTRGGAADPGGLLAESALVLGAPHVWIIELAVAECLAARLGLDSVRFDDWTLSIPFSLSLVGSRTA